MTTLTLRTLRSPSFFHHTSQFQSLTTLHLLSPSSRHASTTSLRNPSKQATKPSPSSQHPTLASRINGPPSTLPAPLDLPQRQPGESFFPKYGLKLGKAYLAFYKAGVRNIWGNYKAAKLVQSTLNSKYDGSLQKAVEAGALSRHDFQLLTRNWFDVKRVPVFALLFMICGEFTPLVVIIVSSVVPWTCRIPKQIEGDRRKLEMRRAISFRNLVASPPTEKGTEGLERQQLIHISWSLGLSSSAWDWLGGQYPGLPTFMLRKKVAKRVEYLEMDDRLIGSSGAQEMTPEELTIALVERGVDVMGKSEKDLKALLVSWQKSTGKVPVENLLLTR
ncbi:hypothetical protein BP5796_07229 [Coleophoma crateriformis]|uniref:Letm1 RBD domain-containing protein n=1 Tax=Coleophoma crateriformis TaxID=565419 RepID=A0A3D8RIB5_9HELO|nr:hypothetical protein BP5796_07229 [Coleophoma crateriformis]